MSITGVSNRGSVQVSSMNVGAPGLGGAQSAAEASLEPISVEPSAIARAATAIRAMLFLIRPSVDERLGAPGQGCALKRRKTRAGPTTTFRRRGDRLDSRVIPATGDELGRNGPITAE